MRVRQGQGGKKHPDYECSANARRAKALPARHLLRRWSATSGTKKTSLPESE